MTPERPPTRTMRFSCKILNSEYEIGLAAMVDPLTPPSLA